MGSRQPTIATYAFVKQNNIAFCMFKDDISAHIICQFWTFI